MPKKFLTVCILSMTFCTLFKRRYWDWSYIFEHWLMGMGIIGVIEYILIMTMNG